jgi:hypothetical protein
VVCAIGTGPSRQGSQGSACARDRPAGKSEAATLVGPMECARIPGQSQVPAGSRGCCPGQPRATSKKLRPGPPATSGNNSIHNEVGPRPRSGVNSS